MSDFLKGLQEKLDMWAIVGFAANAVFTARFVVQWIASERRRESTFPIAFWYLSFAGSIGLLIYGIVRNDPVFILSYAFNGFIYVRNLMLIYRRRAEAKAGGK
jgi:lipid-A-disaccharide synthase-like uncharacterized protein